jgi:dienelactone hydrolase
MYSVARGRPAETLARRRRNYRLTIGAPRSRSREVTRAPLAAERQPVTRSTLIRNVVVTMRRLFMSLVYMQEPSSGRSVAVLLAVAIVLCPDPGFAQERTSFSTQDNAVIYADLYGAGPRGVVLAHGGQFNKESWREQARVLVAAGFRVLAFDFRGYGQSRGPNRTRPPEEDARHLDVMAAVEYLRQTGASTVSVVGASMGGDYAAEASEANPEKIDRLVLLAAGAYTPLIKSKSRKLFIMSRDDVIGDNAPRLPDIRSQYEKASDPKEFVVLDGLAHAQAIFATSQGERLMREVLRFLSTP